MRLIKALPSGAFELTPRFFDRETIPKYAILSHTWRLDSEEVVYQDMIDGLGESKAGYEKIKFCGEQAVKDGLTHFWVDSCCINKSSDAELTESLNSMFRWYRRAEKCYVYLSDVSAKKSKSEDKTNSERAWAQSFRMSRWFTRGWTLQELLAPTTVEFYNREGEHLGDKRSLERHIHVVTGIPTTALRGASLSTFSVDERLSWAEMRQTMREEDRAYSMLGMFDVYIPLIYGEGRANALKRLRKEIDHNVSHVTRPSISAVGVADAVFRFVTFASSLASGGERLEYAGRGRKKMVLYLTTLDQALNSLKIHLGAFQLQNADKTLRPRDVDIANLCSACNKVVDRFLSVLNTLKSRNKDAKGKLWNNFRDVLVEFWGRDEIVALEKELNSFRELVSLHLLASIR
jgi:hypothetical protein